MKRSTEASLGLTARISRRDFLNSTLLGAGVALLNAPGPAFARSAGESGSLMPSGSAWTGYGGVGDYAWSNGNTEAVIQSAHGIRDGKHDHPAIDIAVDEEFDRVIVGSGFSGMAAAYEFARRRRPGQSCIVLDNHPVFGGEAKQNEFLVDGCRLFGPQGSSEFAVLPAETTGRYGAIARLWQELELPREFEFREPEGAGSSLSIPLGSYAPMFWQELQSTVGYFFSNRETGSAGRWVVDVWKDDLARAPFSADVRRELLEFFHRRRVPPHREDYEHWLDSISYRQLLEDELHFSPAVTRFADPLVAIGNFGLGCDGVSAYGALRLAMPGAFEMTGEKPRFEQARLMSFPGGNTAILRAMVKRLMPEAITGGTGVDEFAGRAIRFDRLDLPGSPLRIRQNATVVRVEHEGEPESSETVLVTYLERNRLRRLRARGVVMACGGWVNRRVVRDMPDPLRAAYGSFIHAPVLVVNVALRNWKFLARIGIAAGRWFEGFGFHASLRRPMLIGESPAPLDPGRPVVLTFYVPIYFPGEPPATQASMGRTLLLSRTYRDYEIEIRRHMAELFSPAGFDPRRDIAGIVLNRWGHAYVAPQPGFFFGTGGTPAPRDVIRAGFGRLSFGHSELEGNQNMAHAVQEGMRAASGLSL